MAEAICPCSSQVAVELTADDVPGASLEEPMERHSVPTLRQWLLCRGTEMPTGTIKRKLLERWEST